MNSLDQLALSTKCPVCGVGIFELCWVYKEAEYGLRRITPHDGRIDAAILAMGPTMASVGDLVEIELTGEKL